MGLTWFLKRCARYIYINSCSWLLYYSEMWGLTNRGLVMMLNFMLIYVITLNLANDCWFFIFICIISFSDELGYMRNKLVQEQKLLGMKLRFLSAIHTFHIQCQCGCFQVRIFLSFSELRELWLCCREAELTLCVRRRFFCALFHTERPSDWNGLRRSCSWQRCIVSGSL